MINRYEVETVEDAKNAISQVTEVKIRPTMDLPVWVSVEKDKARQMLRDKYVNSIEAFVCEFYHPGDFSEDLPPFKIILYIHEIS